MKHKISKSQSRRRNRQLIAEFTNEIIAKNDKGIASHGGGLEKKDTTEEIGDEIKDLVNYWVEHRKQVKALVEASRKIISDADKRIVDYASFRNLRAAFAPFLNKPIKRK